MFERLKRSIHAVADPLRALFIGDRRRAVISVEKGEVAAGPNHAVYVHYNAGGDVADYVLQALLELRENGYAVTFVTNSPIDEPAHLATLRILVREIVLRRNVGHDFAAYRDGIRRLADLPEPERLMLLNDSVYGPLFPLAETLEKAEESGADIFGITDSREIEYHLQSYFLLMFPRAIASPRLRRFWRRLRVVSHKPWVVRNGEIRLSQLAVRDGLRLGALCGYDAVAADVARRIDAIDLLELPQVEAEFLAFLRARIAAGIPLNPSHFFWAWLIRDFRCPFLKRELIQKNPQSIPGAGAWDALLRQETGYDTTLIARHLQSI